MISLYSYYCLSNSMVTYESSRMNYINEKEYKLNAREQDIKSVNMCQNQNLSYEKAINHILSLAQNSHKDNIVCNTKKEINSMIEKETDINVEKNKNAQTEKLLTEQEKYSDDSDKWNESYDETIKNKKNAIESELESKVIAINKQEAIKKDVKRKEKNISQELRNTN